MAGSQSVQMVYQIPVCPKRGDDANKGDCGSVLVIGGSRGMSGAACLAGISALRTGAGLVTVAAPVGIVNILAAFEPSYLTLGLPEDDHGRIQQSATHQIAIALPRQTSVAIGPGLGQSASLLELVTELYSTIPVPSVFDADALNLLSKRSYVIKRAPDAPPRILTPHPGEFARLTGFDVAEIQEHRVDRAAEFAAANNLVLILKGQNSVITDGRRVAINSTGNSGMATGGTGDVLTGVIAALLAQGMPAFEAAHLGAHLHGAAGDLAAENFSKHGLIASDLPHFIGRAWCDME